MTPLAQQHVDIGGQMTTASRMTEKSSECHRLIGSHALVTTVCSGATGRCARSLDPRTPARQVRPRFGTCCDPRPLRADDVEGR